LISRVRPGSFEARARVLLPDEPVDQAGLADVGAAGEGHFRQVRGGHEVHADRAHHERDRLGEEHPRRLDLLVRELGPDGGGEVRNDLGFVGHQVAPTVLPCRRAMILSIGFSTP
jgi:hypothetical protein